MLQALLVATSVPVRKPLDLLLCTVDADTSLRAEAVDQPSVETPTEALELVCTFEVREFAVPAAVVVASAQALAVVVLAWAPTLTVLRKSALAS